MESNVVSITLFLDRNVQYRAPLYQRRFRWNVQKARVFWDDLLDLIDAKPGRTHFFGAMVLEKAVKIITKEGSDVSCHNVVDGQQRLITLSLFVSALSRHYASIAASHKDAQDFMKTRNDSDPAVGAKLNLTEIIQPGFLLNATEDEALMHKFRPTVWDEKNFLSIIKKGDPSDARANPWKVYEFFSDEIEKHLNGMKTHTEKLSFIANALRALSRFQISRCFLDAEKDDPNQVFESINSKGERLSSVDLIRNFALMGFVEEVRASHYDNFWKPMEDCLSSRDDDSVPSSLFPDFIRAVLVLRKGELVQKSEVFSVFKEQFEQASKAGGVKGMTVEDLKQLYVYAQSCKALVVPVEEPQSYFERKVFNLNQIGITTHLPLLLKFKGVDPSTEPTADQLAAVMGIVERYFVRRAILNKGVHGIGELFALIAGQYDRAKVPNDQFASWLATKINSAVIEYNNAKGEKCEFEVPQCPTDAEIDKILPLSKAYESNQSICRYVLATLEVRDDEADETKPNKKEFDPKIYGYDLDHVLPQAWVEHWKADLLAWCPGLDETKLSAAVEECTHQIGNLTLSDYNRKMKNYSFSFKKVNAYSDKKCGSFMTRQVGKHDKWTFDMIKQRSLDITTDFKKIWPAL